MDNLLCIEYPGKIQNVDRMLETLGGLRKMTKTAQDPNLRLELRFRPDDVFAKPTCGEKVKETTFLLKGN